MTQTETPAKTVRVKLSIKEAEAKLQTGQDLNAVRTLINTQIPANGIGEAQLADFPASTRFLSVTPMAVASGAPTNGIILTLIGASIENGTAFVSVRNPSPTDVEWCLSIIYGS